MICVAFTPNLQKHIHCPSVEINCMGQETVASILDRLFADHPQLRGYILDDQGGARKHINIFIDNTPIADRVTLDDPVGDGSEIYIMQALSGG